MHIHFLLDKYQILVGVINCREACQKKETHKLHNSGIHVFFFPLFSSSQSLRNQC